MEESFGSKNEYRLNYKRACEMVGRFIFMLFRPSRRVSFSHANHGRDLPQLFLPSILVLPRVENSFRVNETSESWYLFSRLGPQRSRRSSQLVAL